MSQRRILSSAYSLHYYFHSVVAMIVFWRILSWGGFYPKEDFVPYPCTPLLLFIVRNNCISEDFEPRKFLSPRGFRPLLMPSIMVNIQIELVTCLGNFVPRRILSSGYALNWGPCLSYYSNWKILSSGGFYPREDFM